MSVPAPTTTETRARLEAPSVLRVRTTQAQSTLPTRVTHVRQRQKIASVPWTATSINSNSFLVFTPLLVNKPRTASNDGMIW